MKSSIRMNEVEIYQNIPYEFLMIDWCIDSQSLVVNHLFLLQRGVGLQFLPGPTAQDGHDGNHERGRLPSTCDGKMVFCLIKRWPVFFC